LRHYHPDFFIEENGVTLGERSKPWLKSPIGAFIEALVRSTKPILLGS
jgi:hypothetical protein